MGRTGRSSWNLSLKLTPPPSPQSVPRIFQSGLSKLLLRIKLVVDVEDLGYFSEDSEFLASLSGLRVSLAACPPCFMGMPMT